MLMKTKAIVLHAFKFGENKLMVDVFTEQQGRISFAVRIVNSPKAKIKKQYFQPFSVLEIEYDYRQKTNIQTFNNVGIAYPFGSILFLKYFSNGVVFSSFSCNFVIYVDENEGYSASCI